MQLTNEEREAVMGAVVAKMHDKSVQVIPVVESILTAHVDFWKRQAEGFLKAATTDLGRYHRLREGIEELVAKPSIRRWIDDSELVDADDLRSLLAGGDA